MSVSRNSPGSTSSPGATAPYSLIVANVLLGDADRVTEAERHLLTDVVDLRHVGDGAHLIEALGVALVGEQALELPRPIEMILDRVLSTADHDQKVLEAGAYHLLDHVLDRRFVDDRDHLFGLGFGRRQEARTEPGCGNDSFANLHV